MKSLLKKSWPVLALLAGGILIGFELYANNTTPGESWVWIILAGLIVVMSIIEIIHRFLGPPQLPK